MILMQQHSFAMVKIISFIERIIVTMHSQTDHLERWKNSKQSTLSDSTQQQYLVELPGGKLQFALTWDVEKRMVLHDRRASKNQSIDHTD